MAEDTNRGSGTKDRVDRTSVSRLTCIFGSVEVVRAEKMECSEVVSDVNARGCAIGAARRSTAPGRSRSSGYCLQIPRLPHLPGAPAACRGLLFGKGQVIGHKTPARRMGLWVRSGSTWNTACTQSAVVEPLLRVAAASFYGAVPRGTDAGGSLARWGCHIASVRTRGSTWNISDRTSGMLPHCGVVKLRSL